MQAVNKFFGAVLLAAIGFFSFFSFSNAEIAANEQKIEETENIINCG